MIHNHGQALQSFVEDWLKPIDYSMILLRDEGYPCLFYGDFYGIPHDKIEAMKKLKVLIQLRKEKAYGKQHDYFDHPQFIGWTRQGDSRHLKSGLAVVISNAGEGEKKMYVGMELAGEKFMDALENCEEEVIIDEEGCGNFKVKGKSVSIWVR